MSVWIVIESLVIKDTTVFYDYTKAKKYFEKLKKEYDLDKSIGQIKEEEEIDGSRYVLYTDFDSQEIKIYLQEKTIF